jgi:hypothetical protein
MPGLGGDLVKSVTEAIKEAAGNRRGGLDRILNVRHVDLIPCGLMAIHRQIQVRVTQNPKES